jgi:selenocysteine lyase/cysteine desulfurase
MDAVMCWLEAERVGPAEIHRHVLDLQERFLASSPDLGELLIEDPGRRGNFLTYRSDDAAGIYQTLHDRGVITDYRGDRLRIGFGIYHDESDVDRLLAHLDEIRFESGHTRH